MPQKLRVSRFSKKKNYLYVEVLKKNSIFAALLNGNFFEGSI
jgi:hypothetical protein